MKPWITTARKDSLITEIHTLPTNDLHPHCEVGEQCLCGPRVVRYSTAIQVIHTSFDGREATEEGAYQGKVSG